MPACDDRQKRRKCILTYTALTKPEATSIPKASKTFKELGPTEVKLDAIEGPKAQLRVKNKSTR